MVVLKLRLYLNSHLTSSHIFHSFWYIYDSMAPFHVIAIASWTSKIQRQPNFVLGQESQINIAFPFLNTHSNPHSKSKNKWHCQLTSSYTSNHPLLHFLLHNPTAPPSQFSPEKSQFKTLTAINPSNSLLCLMHPLLCRVLFQTQ